MIELRDYRAAKWGALALAGTLALSPVAPAWAQKGDLPRELVAPSESAADAAPASFSRIIKAVGPAVVNVQVERAVQSGNQSIEIPPGVRDFMRRFFGDNLPDQFGVPDGDGPRGEARRAAAVGSGFIIDPTGYVVTNNHVVDGADKVTVGLMDDRTFEATVVGTDPRTDLALLKIRDETADLPFVRWGDSEAAEVGDWVIAMGNPFGLGHTATTGIVSARGRQIGAGPYDDFLQLDAAINRGNSGGPTFNTNGEVIGVNTAIYSPSGGSVGIGFAIPSELAKDVVAKLRESGFVERGWLGVAIQQVTTEIAEGIGLEKAEGAIVSSVNAGGPAAEAGLKTGDVILQVGAERIEEMRELPKVVAGLEPGSETKLEIWRNGERMQKSVTLGTLPAAQQQATVGDQPSERQPSTFGLKLGDLDDATRSRLGLGQDVKGAVISGVDDNSKAAERGLRTGDVIVQVGGEPVASAAEAKQRLEAERNSDKPSTLLLVSRGGNNRFVALPLA